MKTVKKTIIADIISALFILLFVYTATTKLIAHASFKAVLEQSSLIGLKANTLSWVIPLMELSSALLLFIPSTRKWGFISSLTLMLLFTIYIIYMIFLTPHPSCSCGGVIANMTWKQHLLFNIFFTALAAIALRLNLRINFLLQ